MLFNSYLFIFGFLPLVLLVFGLLGRVASRRVLFTWLVVASLLYYGWWNPLYVLLILSSIVLNFCCATVISRRPGRHLGRLTLTLGIAGNLGLLGYFKYVNFFVDTLNVVAAASYELAPVVLPLAISFFTFQQIAFLVDAYRGETEEHSFIDYSLFVTFFPQLIAGPIVHHKEMLPQFTSRLHLRLRSADLAIGGTIFSIGLFKKVVIADTLAAYATPVFAFANGGNQPDFVTSWLGVLAYSLQIYFDFSGYSDMAIGLGRLFGIKLPLNFDSPYKATNIAEFWRRWHMTLSRFLRDYLYIPLGGNRKGEPRRYANVMATMLLGGLWHGAGWQFVVWGGLHGVYLVVHRLWAELRRRLWGAPRGSAWGRGLARLVTFVCVCVAWVYFRADGFESANRLLESMLGMHGWLADDSVAQPLDNLVRVSRNCLLVLVLAWTLPNTQEWMSRFEPALAAHGIRPLPARWERLLWRPTLPWAVGVSALFLIAVLRISEYSEFIYFQF